MIRVLVADHQPIVNYGIRMLFENSNDIKIVNTVNTATKDKAAKSTAETLMPKNPQTLTPQQLAKEITRLEDEMFQAAKSLEFERAAAIRDAVAELQSLAFK